MAPFIDSKVWLAKKFDQKKKLNSQYSLRAFAKDIGMPVSSLSQIMTGKRSITLATGQKLAAQLCHSDAERKLFLESLVAGDRVNQDRRYKNLESEHFTIIRNWYHFAILSLANLSDAPFDANWIARRLNITPKEAHDALGILVRSKFIENKMGLLVATLQNVAISSKYKSEAIQQSHRDHLKLAELALAEIDPKNREMSTMTFAFSVGRMEEAKAMLIAFRRHFGESLEAPGNGDEVYALSQYFFPLTRRIEMS